MTTVAAPELEHPRYEAGPLLGRGSQGAVLRVIDREAPERALVAKVWQGGRFEESALAAEFAFMRRLDLRGLVRAHDWGRDARSGAAFFVEDFVDGIPASEFVAQVQNQRAERLFTVLSELAVTLAGLHDAAFVHGDLKPDHVRVTPSERILLLDWGAALRIGQEAVAFTRAYAAPEVVAGARPSALADLFSLGMTCWALVTGAPRALASTRLRTLVSWVPPSLAEIIEALIEPHPRDRPQSAEHLLRSLGQSDLSPARRGAPPPIGRARELAALTVPNVGVRYLTGPSGSGKSHLLRELVTRGLLAGRAARRVGFPGEDAPFISQLIAFFRGHDGAWPFAERGQEQAPLLLALDDFQAAPEELVAALDAYRCRGRNALPVDVLAATRTAPSGAAVVELGALDDASFAKLCRVLGVNQPERVAELARLGERSPGFVVAALGRVPLTRDMVLERAKGLSPSAKPVLAALALLGGSAAEHWLTAAAESKAAAAALEELVAQGLVLRHSQGGLRVFSLAVPEVAEAVASALGSFDLVESLAARLLAESKASARLLIALAECPFPPAAREALLARAAEVARRDGPSGDESAALFALCAGAALRTRERLVRLERLSRQAGRQHPQVLSWLAVAAPKDATLEPLLFRRQAEQAARAGDFALAQARAADAEQAARALDDAVALSLAVATRGAVALFQADVAAADRFLSDAAARLSALRVDDSEELARLEHNRGVVALYGNHVEEAVQAFERSLEIKRSLGDRAGVRSCLLNLGLALSRRELFERAAEVLDEAILLAGSLEQRAGRAWCLAARADLEVRRADALAAERFIAEARAISDAPAMVCADLSVLEGQAALLVGDAQGALRALAGLSAELRASDVSLDAKASLVEGFARLCHFPVERKRVARLAVSVIRSARRARLSELAEQGVSLLRAARSRQAPATGTRYVADVEDGEAQLWSWLETVAAGSEPSSVALDLLRRIRVSSQAERVFIVECDEHGVTHRVWGVDSDGYLVSEAAARCDASFVRRALEAGGTLYRRDVTSAVGPGARLALPAPAGNGASRAVVVLEHRFRVGAFDALSERFLARVSVLSGVLVRLSTEPGRAATAPRVAAASLVATRLPDEALDSTARPPRSARTFAGIVGSSRALSAALARLDSAVDSDLPTLINGETGAGKEVFARALHDLGPRAQGPFVAVNCAAISESLFEAELFGHARGAFTGADRARAGLLARADGGSLFLDEIADLPLPRQAALLRALETRRYRALGTDDERSFDVRLICASNKDLVAEVARGTFRQDLQFRINVIEILVPPLRERSSDIPLLVRTFIARKKGHLVISDAAMSALEHYAWPGNVRELEHQVERLLALGIEQVEFAHLPRTIRQGQAPQALPDATPSVPRDERFEVETAIRAAGGNITHAARALGLTRHGLKKRMLRLGLRAPSVQGSGS